MIEEEGGTKGGDKGEREIEEGGKRVGGSLSERVSYACCSRAANKQGGQEE